MIRYRAYRNGDSPALADLWARDAPEQNTVRALTVHEYDLLVPGKLGFDRNGLIVAERDTRIVGFAHAGFGPVAPRGPTHRLDRALGTVAMLVIDRDVNEPDLARGLLAQAEAYLRRSGARVIYAGGQYPLNPYYWGLYGGSEFAGILDGHRGFHEAVRSAGFEQAARTILFEAPLSDHEPRDLRLAPVRRNFRVDIEEDALTNGWWDALALGLFHPTRFQLIDRQSGITRAEAWTWDIASGMAVDDGRTRTGMISLEVHPDFRRRGLARALVVECFKHARNQLAEVLCAQTSTENLAANCLYQSLGFEPVEHATLYRLPAGVTLL